MNPDEVQAALGGASGELLTGKSRAGRQPSVPAARTAAPGPLAAASRSRHVRWGAYEASRSCTW